MGLAYGAADEPGSGGFARRVGVIIDPEGRIRDWQPKVDAAGYPAEALEKI